MTVQRRYVSVDPDNQELSIATDQIPGPGPGQILIRVAAAGLNRADLLQRMGLYPPPEDASPVLGLEVAGEVQALGADVSGWDLGDPICALTHGGGYADHAVAPVGQCFRVPAGFSMAEAAALPEALLTVWHNLYQRGNLQAGQKVLIHGGASGIGTLGIQMAHALGSEVYTTAGTPEKCARLEQLGARRAFNYNEEDFEQSMAELGLKGAIHVILDMVGGDYIQKNIEVAAPEGRIVNIAFQRGFTAEVNFAPLLMKRLTLTGSTLRAQSFAQKAVMKEEILERVWPYLEDGSIRPVVHQCFPLAEAAAAHALMQSGAHTGKIILTT